MTAPKRPARQAQTPMGISVLAGGLALRMGGDKARLRLGRRTLLGHVKAAAAPLGAPVRVIRRDLVPRCGPLGGVYTALATSSARAEMLLACDMPFITLELLAGLQARFLAGQRAVFTRARGQVGFPFVLSTDLVTEVGLMIQQGQHSLWQLAKRLKANYLAVRDLRQLANINRREELDQARALLQAATNPWTMD